MSRESIRRKIEEMAEGSRIIDEMRRDGTFPASEGLVEMRDSLRDSNSPPQGSSYFPKMGNNFRTLDNHSGLMSNSNLPDNVGKDPTALGWQARVALYNAGNETKYHPEMTNSNLEQLSMDLMDQAGIPYNMENLFEEK